MGGGSASALDCPVPQTLGAGSAAETSSAFAEKFTADQLNDQAPAIVAKLRSQFPDADAARLTNFLITAYCDKIVRAKNAAEVSEADKRDRLAAYAKWLGSILY
jgi:hypothetical protein